MHRKLAREEVQALQGQCKEQEMTAGKMMVTDIRNFPTRCSNLNCTNAVGQGQFTLITINGVQLLLCKPCSLRIEAAES